MNKSELKKLLEDYKNNLINEEVIIQKLKQEPFEDLGFAKVDHQRELRQGYTEVIYGAGKTAEQIEAIINSLIKKNNKTVLITRLSNKKAKFLKRNFNLNYFNDSKIGLIGDLPESESKNEVVVASGGTSDLPVAEEAAITLEAFGNKVFRLYDVGVAGIHRLFNYLDKIMNASCIVVVAGMEGALASVIGGLADCPVIAVPTSVGYGASFGGVSALLSMLNSCASGVSVVNIDNGFGAGYIASMINKMKG